MTKLTTVALVVICLFTTSSESADELRPSDDATIIISADESWEDIAEDVFYFSANVNIRTPGWSLQADKVTVYGNLEDPERIVADGTPVQFAFSKAGSADDPDIRGTGSHLEYLCGPEVIKLSGDARLTGDRQIMRSDEISYDLVQEKLLAGGPDGVHIRVEADSSGRF